MKIAVVGASGFVGGAVAQRLEELGHKVIRVSGVRLGPVSSRNLAHQAAETEPPPELLAVFRDVDAVVNAAGDPDASRSDEAELNAPNALLVALLGKAVVASHVRRFVHISSAVVQGDKSELDSSSEVKGFSAYARSKIAGEELAIAYGPEETVVYRPPSVHHESRRVTRQLHKIANSWISTVASPGDAPTPQALISSVAAAVSTLVLSDEPPPQIVHHPWEGLTTSSLLEVLSGGRAPKKIPRWLANLIIGTGASLAKVVPALSPYVRRVELVWFGQGVAETWLGTTDIDQDNWTDLRNRINSERSAK